MHELIPLSAQEGSVLAGLVFAVLKDLVASSGRIVRLVLSYLSVTSFGHIVQSYRSVTSFGRSHLLCIQSFYRLCSWPFKPVGTLNEHLDNMSMISVLVGT